MKKICPKCGSKNTQRCQLSFGETILYCKDCEYETRSGDKKPSFFWWLKLWIPLLIISVQSSCLEVPACRTHFLPTTKEYYVSDGPWVSLPKSGILTQIDTSMDEGGLNALDDRLFSLQEKYPDGRWDCLRILVTPEWQYSCDGKEQLLAHHAPQTGCNKKGFDWNSGCPCRYRGVFQEDFWEEGKDWTLFVIPPQASVLEVYLSVYVNDSLEVL